MHHAALDGPGPDDGHLDYQVVKALGLQARQHRHLGPALDLEDAHGVRLPDHGVGDRALGRHVLHADRAAALVGDEVQGAVDRAEHAQRQDVDLDETKRIEVVLVPLDDRAVLHGGVFHRHQAAELVPGDDEAAGVLTQMPRKASDGAGDRQPLPHLPGLGVQAVLDEAGIADPGLALDAVGGLGQALDHLEREAQCLAHIPERRLGPVGGDHASKSCAMAAVLAVDVLHDLFAPLVLEVYVDVRRLSPLHADEPFEEHVHAAGVDLGHEEAVAHGRVGR